MTMQRWKLTVEYKGTGYYGWQRQDDGPTIQGAIEDAVYKFCQQRLTVQGSGRTDAGVHALAQIAHLDLDYGERDLSGHDLAKAINAHLRPQPITVINAVKVSQDFHARFSAKKKLYHYRIVNRRAFLTRDQDLAWRFKRPLDPVAMHDAAQILLGHHDFSTFRDSECQAQSPEKTLDQLDVTAHDYDCLLYTSPSPRDQRGSRMPSSA